MEVQQLKPLKELEVENSRLKKMYADLSMYEESDIPLLRILTDRGTEYCGAREHHEYQLYLAIELTKQDSGNGHALFPNLETYEQKENCLF